MRKYFLLLEVIYRFWNARYKPDVETNDNRKYVDNNNRNSNLLGFFLPFVIKRSGLYGK